ncbi:hypothetical protein MKW98_000564 [Papaver atlanticum]|uniref:Uncharacterized protein n=1 Tax=Papaver atlanticum TaxID=357466 RepID=A0AAD4X8S0_9MAGN|nr:hypothetical protein MKW98_000564 [Papaver atlanticum]
MVTLVKLLRSAGETEDWKKVNPQKKGAKHMDLGILELTQQEEEFVLTMVEGLHEEESTRDIGQNTMCFSWPVYPYRGCLPVLGYRASYEEQCVLIKDGRLSFKWSSCSLGTPLTSRLYKKNVS